MEIVCGGGGGGEQFFFPMTLFWPKTVFSKFSIFCGY